MVEALISIPPKNQKLAEFVGIMLGDGNVFLKNGYGQVRIFCNPKDELDYATNFIRPLLSELFGIQPRIYFPRTNPEIVIALDSVKLARFLVFDLGLSNGSKIKNLASIPLWVKNDISFLKSCIRGLIDTDGSVFRMSNKDYDNPRLSFKNYSRPLLIDARDSLIRMGFNPSKIIGKQFFISRLADVKRYEEEIGFNNPKNHRRLVQIAPWCSGQAYKYREM